MPPRSARLLEAVEIERRRRRRNGGLLVALGSLIGWCGHLLIGPHL